MNRTSLSLILLLATSSASGCFAANSTTELIQKKFESVIKKHQLEKQEFKPIIFDKNGDTSYSEEIKEIETISNSKLKNISIKNELFQSVKLILSSKTDYKVIYLSPYEKLDDTQIYRAEDYTIKVFDLNEKYLGNLIRTDLKKIDLVKISPFLIFPELARKDASTNGELISKEKTINGSTIESQFIEQKIITTQKIEAQKIEPKEIEIPTKLVPDPKLYIKAIPEFEAGNQFKVANISDFKVKVTIKKANGENIGTSWTIDNDTYSPEALKFAAQEVLLEPDTTINISYLDKYNNIKKEISLLANQIPKDPENNYSYFIENISKNIDKDVP